jgi:lysophospholipase L1-like esterase
MATLTVLIALPSATGCAARPTPPRSAPNQEQQGHRGHQARPGCARVPAPRQPPADGVTVVVGASIAEGFRTSRGEQTAWPDLLAGRLRQGRVPLAVANHSVDAARLLADTVGQPCTSALHREGPALAVPGVRTLVLTDLVNDIQQTPHVYDPQVIIAGLKEFVTMAHARQVRVVATTITPYDGFVSHDPAGERTRQAINAYIRNGGLFDGVLDFDSVVRDPSHPNRLRPAYDSGDHLHLDDAGQRALARSVPPAPLVPPSAAPSG